MRAYKHYAMDAKGEEDYTEENQRYQSCNHQTIDVINFPDTAHRSKLDEVERQQFDRLKQGHELRRKCDCQRGWHLEYNKPNIDSLSPLVL